MISWLASHLWWSLSGVALTVALLVWFVAKRVRASTKKNSKKADPEPEPEPATIDLSRHWVLRTSFNIGVGRLRGLAQTSEARYEFPWYLMLGQAGSRPGHLLGNAGITLPIGPPSEDETRSGLGCSWWFLDRGVVLDLAGEYVLRQDGNSSSDRGWGTFLRLLQQHRPERPLDGLILTISCADLLDAARRPDGLPELERRANLIHRKVHSAQHELGLRLPVFMIITGCDAVDGFDAFVRTLPPERRDEILGWSNQYDIGASFEAEWIDQAFDSLHHRLQQAHVDLFGRVAAGERRDELFLFPDRLDEIRVPLQGFMATLLQPSAYREAPFFRGFYFSGAESLDQAGGDPAHPQSPIVERFLAEEPASETPRTFFLHDLFAHKVFAEAALAVPTRGTLLARNRRVRFAQFGLLAATVVLILGNWFATQRLTARERTLIPLLGQVSADMASLDAGARPGADPAYRALESIALTDLNWYGSVFIPTSWVSPLNSRLRRVLAREFDELVLPAMSARLSARADQLLNQARLALEQSAVDIRRRVEDTSYPDQTPEFQALHDFVVGVEELESQVRVFNGLSASVRIDEFSELVEYTLGRRLPDGFLERGYLYRDVFDAVENVHRFDDASYRAAFSARALELARGYYVGLESNALTLRLDALQRSMDRFAQTASTAGPSLEELLAQLDNVDGVVRAPEFGWMFAPEFDLGSAFEGVLEIMDRTPALAGLRDDVVQAGVTRLADIQGRFLVQGATYTGPFLARTVNFPSRPIQELSETSVRLRSDLAQLLDEGFMPVGGIRAFELVIPDGSRLLWDTVFLEQAVTLHQGYEDFWQRAAASFSGRFEADIGEIVRARLGSHIGDLVATSQRFLPAGSQPAFLRTNEIREEVESFRAASEYLNQLLVILERRLRLPNVANDLSTIIASQADRLLSDANELLDNASPYSPRDGGFDWWDGVSAVIPVAYDVRDSAELDLYLQTQRDRTRAIASEYARPVLESLGQSRRWNATVRAAAPWEALLGALDAFDNGTPGNSVSRLETFIKDSLSGVNLATCRGVAPLPPGARRVDYFAERERALRERLITRCADVSRDVAIRRYADLARAFNDNLASRRPFVDPSRVTADTPSVSPATLRGFFQRFDANAALIRALPADLPEFRGVGADVQNFLARLQAGREFFAAFLDSETTSSPSFDVQVEFRVNRDNEIGGNQVIAWSLTVGDQTRSWPGGDPSQTMRWTAGETIRLELRWALNSPIQPTPKDLPRTARVAGGSVFYEFSDPWSLLSFVRQQSATPEDFSAFADPDPHTLVFNVQTRGAGTLEDGLTRVYARMRIVSPESEARLRLPGMPSIAPVIVENDSAVNPRVSSLDRPRNR